MKKILYAVIIIFALIHCNTPNKTIGNPDATTNTSGAAGSGNMTNSNAQKSADVRTPAGAPQDTAAVKKDSIPR